MTAVKIFANDAVSMNAALSGDFRDRKLTTSLKVLKETETDVESNVSSSEEMEYYSPKSVTKKWPITKVNISRGRLHNPILRIRAEESQIGEDIGDCFSKIAEAWNDRVDVIMFSRPASPLSGKDTSSIKN